MAEISDKNINVHVQKIANLKNQFIKSYKENENVAKEIIDQMRISHGCAIYDAFFDLMELVKKPKEQINNNEWIKISVNESLLLLMQKHIEHVCKLILSKREYDLLSTEAKLNQELNSSHAENENNVKKNNIITKFRPSANGTDEISLTNMQTEYGTKPFTNDKSLQNNSNYQQYNTTDYINNLTTTEANRIVSEYEKNKLQNGGGNGPTNQKIVGLETPSNQTVAALNSPSNQTVIALNAPSNQDVVSANSTKQNGGEDVKKITIINFWADWCPFSKKFHPEWEKFKETAHKKFPDLKIADLNVQQNAELEKIAKKAGVRGYPTVILYHNGKMDEIIAGDKTAKDIEKFVKENI